MPDAHAAAVEAMAAAMGRGLMGQTHYREQAKAALAALVRSEAVRAALVAKVHHESVGDWPLDSDEGRAVRWWVDAILAALAPGEAG